MRILGLDPGSIHTGYGVVEGSGATVKALALGRISSPRGRSVPQRLAHLATEVTALMGRWQPELVVLESPFHHRNSRSLIVLAEARGALLAAVAGSGAEIREFTPAEVKSAVTGNGRADKEQVSRMVRMLLRLDGDRLASDAADALAVALCCAQRLRMDRLATAGRGSIGGRSKYLK